MDWVVKETYWSLMGPKIREYDITYPHFDLSHGTYLAVKP